MKTTEIYNYSVKLLFQWPKYIIPVSVGTNRTLSDSYDAAHTPTLTDRVVGVGAAGARSFVFFIYSPDFYPDNQPTLG